MENLKNAVFGLCVVLIASGVIMMIAPKGNMEKPMRFLMSAVVLVVLLSAFSSFDFSADFDILQKNKVEEAFADATAAQMESAAKEALTGLIKNYLESREINHFEIDITINKSERGDIYFSNVTVLLPPEYGDKVAEVNRFLKEQIGKDIIVTEKEK